MTECSRGRRRRQRCAGISRNPYASIMSIGKQACNGRDSRLVDFCHCFTFWGLRNEYSSLCYPLIKLLYGPTSPLCQRRSFFAFVFAHNVIGAVFPQTRFLVKKAFGGCRSHKIRDGGCHVVIFLVH